MNFFEEQDKARKKSKLLVLYFILSVVGTASAIYLVVRLAMIFMQEKVRAEGLEIGGPTAFWDWQVFLGTLLGVGLLICSGSAFKTMQLNAGGSVVARDLGGRLIDPSTSDTHERRLLNVVEEMAIAAGLPVPQVWVMDNELGINAFAAGTKPSNAVIGVTKGTLLRLNRSELQGVIAHEFSHILNGDMRLNMRLVGGIFGILMIGLIGRMMINSMRYTHVSSNDRRDGGGAVIAIFAIGAAVWAIGSIGEVFARLIQAAISRQREYLADASAVQFTREPDGIANALKKIGGTTMGSKVTESKAGEASHMFFANAGLFSFGFRTHPPLEQRIKAIDPNWDGKYLEAALPEIEDKMAGDARSKRRPSSKVAAISALTDDIPGSIGEEEQTLYKTGQYIKNGLESKWVISAHDADAAQSMMFGLLLAQDDNLRNEELTHLQNKLGDHAAVLAKSWQLELAHLHSWQKIALIDIAIPTLRRMSFPEYERFIETARWLVASDGQVDLFEFMLEKVIERHLESHFHRTGFGRIRYRSIDRLENPLCVLLSTLSGVGAKQSEERDRAFSAAQAEYRQHLGRDLKQLPPEKCSLSDVDKSLEEIHDATPLVKRQVLRLCALVVVNDKQLTNREAELLRAIGDAIDANLPPIVQQQKLVA